MALSGATTRSTYNGDGSTTSFSTGFKFLLNSHVKVVLRSSSGTETTWVEGTQYTLTGAGNSNGGTVTVSTSPTDYTPASGERLIIYRDAPLTQPDALPLGGAFPSTTVEQMADRLTMIAQQLSEKIGRSLLLPVSSSTSGLSLPEPSADKVLGWNSGGTALENKTPNTQAYFSVSAFMETVLDDADAAAARTTLGAGDVSSTRALTAGNGLTGGGDLSADRSFAVGAGDGISVSADAVALDPSYLRAFLAGLGLSNNGTDANNDIDIASGVCVDSTNAKLIKLAAGVTRQLDVAFGTGNGGLSSSLTKANSTEYHVHAVITSGGAASVGFDTSATAANLVADHGITHYRRIGSIFTDSSGNIRAFKQTGDYFLWPSGIHDLDTANGNTTSRSLRTLTVPTGAKRLVKVRAYVADANDSVTILQDPDETDAAPNNTMTPPGGSFRNTVNFQGVFEVTCMTNTSGQIATRCSAATKPLDLVTVAYWDRRGKDD